MDAHSHSTGRAWMYEVCIAVGGGNAQQHNTVKCAVRKMYCKMLGCLEQ